MSSLQKWERTNSCCFQPCRVWGLFVAVPGHSYTVIANRALSCILSCPSENLSPRVIVGTPGFAASWSEVSVALGSELTSVARPVWQELCPQTVQVTKLHVSRETNYLTESWGLPSINLHLLSRLIFRPWLPRNVWFFEFFEPVDDISLFFSLIKYNLWHMFIVYSHKNHAFSFFKKKCILLK